ncbi:hypothetical protein RhiJN_18426 [Ceratobasidium sp. AG-Ba]|nr:hypothetical protein RhiJN_18426 [Ceratobasidium sp. AG-Ba]
MESPNTATSLSLGTSSHSASDGSQSTTRDAVGPYIRADLQHSETCGFDNLLGVLLFRCVSENLSAPKGSPVSTVDPSTPHIPQTGVTAPLEDSPSSDKTADSASQKDIEDLRDRCLEAVLPLCNDATFRHKIQKFRDASGVEDARYAPFVEACNYGFKEMKTLVVPGLCSSNSDILFHVNDPKIIYGYNNSRRAPDVVIVSLATIKHVRGNPKTTWLDATDERCHKSPYSGFNWSEIVSFVEFKRLKSIKSKFPEKYDKAAHVRHPAKDMSNISGFPDTPSSTATSTNASSMTSRSSHSGGDADQKMDIDESPEPASPAPITQTRVSSVKDRVNNRTVSGSSKNRPKSLSPELDQKTARDLAQCAGYAAEMLTSIVGRPHVIGMYLVDQVLWVWWYDRQGAIQSTGIDIVQDLPRFAALLLAFQRFGRADWGYDPTFDPEITSKDTSKVDHVATLRKIHFEGLDVAVDLSDIIHETYCLSGRGTTVLGASDANPTNASPSLVLKCSWANKLRPTEKAIIEKAIKVAPQAKDHLPKVFASRDLGDTESIRRELGIHKASSRPFRVFRIAVYERLIPITNLAGAVRMIVFLDTIKCHQLVWKGGVHHRDLSLSNLMVRVINGVCYGTLNDFDLSHITELDLDINEHTATLPFLAMDLLCNGYWAGNIDVKYRHDWESFVWIIYWLARCSESATGLAPPDLQTWKTGIIECRKSKLNALWELKNFPRPIDTLEWRAAAPLLRFLDTFFTQRPAPYLNQGASNNAVVAEPTEATLLEEISNQVIEALPAAYQALKRTPADQFPDHALRLLFFRYIRTD